MARKKQDKQQEQIDTIKMLLKASIEQEWIKAWINSSYTPQTPLQDVFKEGFIAGANTILALMMKGGAQ